MRSLYFLLALPVVAIGLQQCQQDPDPVVANPVLTKPAVAAQPAPPSCANNVKLCRDVSDAANNNQNSSRAQAVCDTYAKGHSFAHGYAELDSSWLTSFSRFAVGDGPNQRFKETGGNITWIQDAFIPNGLGGKNKAKLLCTVNLDKPDDVLMFTAQP
jgi:hypothetical protein